MQAFALNIKKCIWVDINSTGSRNVLCQSFFVLVLDIHPLFLECGISRILFQIAQQRMIFEKFLALESRGNERREMWIRLVQPATRCHSIGNVCKSGGTKELDKLREELLSNQFRVKLSYTIHSVATNDSQNSHANVLGRTLFNDGHFTQLFAVAWILSFH